MQLINLGAISSNVAINYLLNSLLSLLPRVNYQLNTLQSMLFLDHALIDVVQLLLYFFEDSQPLSFFNDDGLDVAKSVVDALCQRLELVSPLSVFMAPNDSWFNELSDCLPHLSFELEPV